MNVYTEKELNDVTVTYLDAWEDYLRSNRVMYIVGDTELYKIQLELCRAGILSRVADVKEDPNTKTRIYSLRIGANKKRIDSVLERCGYLGSC